MNGETDLLGHFQRSVTLESNLNKGLRKELQKNKTQTKIHEASTRQAPSV